MIRRILLSAVLGTGLVTGLTLTPATAEAQPGNFHHRRFEVVYLQHHHWHVYGVFHNRFEADRAAAHLQRHGHPVQIRVI